MIFKLLKRIVFVLIFLFIFSRVNRAYAVSSLDEEFGSTPSSQLWVSEKNNGNIESLDGSLKLSAPPGSTYPYLYLENGPEYLNGNFVFETRFKFYGFQNYGYGIILADKLLLNGTSIPLGLSDFIFALWPLGESTRSFSLTTILCSSSSTTCNDYSLAATASWDSWHILKIIRSGQIYFAYLDGGFIFESKPTAKIISQLWLGNPQRTGGIIWGNLLVDYIKINVSTPTPTPTPSPTPEPLRPIIILPGLGGSWDYGAILSGTAGTNWQVPSFITLYKNLIDSLKNAGYVEGTNLFVFGYDWRKGLTDLAGDLNNYVNGLGLTGKIDFIGHSYGGLVARTYGQNIGIGKIDKIITAGSPHQGVIDAYGLWEGATVWKNVWWQRAALELMTKLNQQPGENRVDTVRRLAPGIKDTLPTFDFLKKNDLPVSSSSLLQKNVVLGNLNGNTATIDGLLWANGGNNNQTDRFLKVVNRGWLEKTQGLWEDGKPIESPFETTIDGDGAVLSLSSTNTFSHQALIAANHEQIISSQDSLEKIFEELGLDKNKVVSNVTPDSRKSVFIASLRSPGNLHVCDGVICDGNLGIYLPDQKLFFLPGYNNQTLTASVDAAGETGSYQLYVGDMDEGQTNWRDQKGNLITSSQVDTYQVTSSDGEFDISGDSQTSSRSFDENLSVLNGLLPNWDKKNLVSVMRSESQPRNKRIVAIRQLREQLSRLVIKAHKNNRSDQIEAIINVWTDIDDLAETVIGSGNSTKGIFLNANIAQVEAYKILGDNLLRNSTSYYAGVFYTLFTERFDEAKEIKTTRRDLSLDKTLSARYLLLTALGIK